MPKGTMRHAGKPRRRPAGGGRKPRDASKWSYNIHAHKSSSSPTTTTPAPSRELTFKNPFNIKARVAEARKGR